MVLGAWNAGRYHHLDLHEIVDNNGNEMWVGFMDGNPGGKQHPFVEENMAQRLMYDDKCIGPQRTKTMNNARLVKNEVNAARDKVLIAAAREGLPAPHDERSTLALTAEANTKTNSEMNNKLCFITAASSSHFRESMAQIKTVRERYPCNPLYIYDLGFSAHELDVMKKYGNVHIFPLQISRPYFEFGACVFKAPMFADFIARYDKGEHRCEMAYYGDAHTIMMNPFDEAAYLEVKRLGLVAEHAMNNPQIEMTHPGMFPYFNYDRDVEYENSMKGDPLNQVQAGLLLFDVTNHTLREKLFKPWSECCLNAACLSPDNYRTHGRGGILDKFPLKNGKNVFRTHRDDQSAFTFLIDTLFGRNGASIRKVHLNSYVRAYWRSSINEKDALDFMTKLPTCPK